MMFALNQIFWLDGVFLWTNSTSFNINVLWTNRTYFNINVSEFKSFNKTIVYFWYRLASYLSTQEVIITSAVDFGNHHFFWVDKSSCQPYEKSLIVHKLFFTEVPVLSQESDRSCICVLLVSMFASFYDISFGFWVWYLLFFILSYFTRWELIKSVY
jgi:hypothetical protein